MSTINDLLTQYQKASGKNERSQFLQPIIDYFLDFGPSNFRLNVWGHLNPKEKEQFVGDIFNHLIEVPSGGKIIVLDVLEVLFLDTSLTNDELQVKLLYIFYAALFEKKNYKLALSALGFFSHLWVNTDSKDPIRAEIFPKLLDFLDNKDPLLAEEGIFETTKILEDATSRERERVFEALLQMAESNKIPSVRYAVYEALGEILVKYLYDLKSFPPALLTTRILRLLHTKQPDPKPIFALLRLIFQNKFSLKEEDEKAILKHLKHIFGHLSYEIMGQFWQAVFDFTQNAGYLPISTILKPFLSKMQKLFKNREEIAPEVGAILENMVTWLWEVNALTAAQQNEFY